MTPHSSEYREESLITNHTTMALRGGVKAKEWPSTPQADPGSPPPRTNAHY